MRGRTMVELLIIVLFLGFAAAIFVPLAKERAEAETTKEEATQTNVAEGFTVIKNYSNGMYKTAIVEDGSIEVEIRFLEPVQADSECIPLNLLFGEKHTWKLAVLETKLSKDGRLEARKYQLLPVGSK